MKKYLTKEEIYKNKWKELIENKDGSLNKEKVMCELADYKNLMDNVAIVFKEITGGRLSKPHTNIVSILEEYSENVNRQIKEILSKEEENV